MNLKEYGIPFCKGCSMYLNDEDVQIIEGDHCCRFCAEAVSFLNEDAEMSRLDEQWWSHLDSTEEGQRAIEEWCDASTDTR